MREDIEGKLLFITIVGIIAVSIVLSRQYLLPQSNLVNLHSHV